VARDTSEPGSETPVSSDTAQDAQTIAEVLRAYEREGYHGQFRAIDGARIECFTCHESSAASTVAVEQMARLEGPTDPADMVAVMGITCPRCSTRGTLLLGFGPEATLEDAEAFSALPDARHGSGVPGSGD
jgi:hypothetical protein